MLTKTLTVTTLAALSLALTACGGSDPAPAATTGAVAATAGETSPAAAPVDVDTTVEGTGMKGGCDGVHKIFLALAAGNTAAAEELKEKARPLFDDVAATAATDLPTAKDGASMWSRLGFELPDDPTMYRSELAEDYTSICVGKYEAAPLPG